MWTCPQCDRDFSRAGQSHTCVPAGTLAETLADVRPDLRTVAEAALAALVDIGPVAVEPVRVGIFTRRVHKLAEIRPKATFVQLIVMLPRPVDDPRIARHDPGRGDRIAHYIRLRTVDDLDDQVRSWLAEAYDLAG
jgi:hypothetical protein